MSECEHLLSHHMDMGLLMDMSLETEVAHSPASPLVDAQDGLAYSTITACVSVNNIVFVPQLTLEKMELSRGD